MPSPAPALAQQLLSALTEAGHTLVTAESCTGGGLGAALTAIPGSSSAFLGGIISYANAVKERQLGVPAALLQAHGAVSSEVAFAMARGARLRLESDFAVAITGVAGPGGGSLEKPVGTVWIAWVGADLTEAQRFLFEGDREAVRQRAIVAALQGLLARLPAAAEVAR